MMPAPNWPHSKKRESMTAETLTQVLTRLAQGKKPWLAITVKWDGDFFDASVIAVHQGRTIARFGNRRRRTPAEVKEAICHYFTFELEIYPAKQRWIESEIERLNEKVRKKAIHDEEETGSDLR
jgi:hypothetical protein